MTLAPPNVADLAAFTGRASNTFGLYAEQALAQSTLLFFLATELENYPTDSNLAQLAKNGIMEMADKIYLSQPYQESTASPFSSETIGSYSYTKSVSAVKKGEATGVMWFDLAVNKLRSVGSGIGDSGAITGMEFDGVHADSSGRYKITGASGTYHMSAGAWEIDTLPPPTIY